MLSKLVILTIITLLIVTIIRMVTSTAAQVRAMAEKTMTEPLTKAQKIYDETNR